MTATVVSTWPNPGLLGAVRSTIDGTDDALLCVAFADTRGVHLLQSQLRSSRRARLLCTSVFDRARTDAALAVASEADVECRILNWRGGTYHPKMYLGRRDRAQQAVIGSANLTSGLFGNVEVGVVVDESAAGDAFQIGEELWDHPDAVAWVPSTEPVVDQLEPDLMERLAPVVSAGSVVHTLAGQQPNRIVDFSIGGIMVETDRSGPLAQPVEPRMIQVAWDWLTTHGWLENRVLLNDLAVHRSSFVCALLAELPEVDIESRSPIRLRLRDQAVS